MHQMSPEWPFCPSAPHPFSLCTMKILFVRPFTCSLLRLFPALLLLLMAMVSCLEDNEGNQNIRGLRLEGASDITSPGQKLYLKAYFVPAHEVSDTILWSVTPKEVAKIDAHGVLTPLKNGTVRVVATAPKEEISVAVIVNISRQRVPAERISIINEAPISDLGGKLQLGVLIEPEGAVSPELVWEVNNPRLATITPSGLLSAHSNGTVTVHLSKVVDGTKTLLDEVFVTLTNQNLLEMYKGNWRLSQLKNVNFSGYNHDADSAVKDMIARVQPLFLKNRISFDRVGRIVIRQFDGQSNNLSTEIAPIDYLRFEAYSDTLNWVYNQQHVLTTKSFFQGDELRLSMDKESLRTFLLAVSALHKEGLATPIDTLFRQTTLEQVGISVLGLNVTGIFFPQMLTDDFLMSRFAGSLRDPSVSFSLTMVLRKEEE